MAGVSARGVSSWKSLLIVLTMVGSLLALYDTAIQWVIPTIGDPGFDVKPGSAADTIEVIAVDPGSRAQAAGLQVGDRMDVTRLDWRDRTNLPGLSAYSVAGTSFSLPVLRKTSVQTIRFAIPRTSHGASTSVTNFLLSIGVLWMLGFAFAIGRRRPDDPNARSICNVLLAYALGWGLWNFACSLDWANLLANWAGLPGFVLSATLFTLFALRSVDNTWWRRAARFLAWAVFGASVVFSMATTVGILTGRPNPVSLVMQPLAGIWFHENYHFIVARSFALLCGIWAIASSRGADRQRIAWATAATAPTYLSTLIVQPLVISGLVSPALYEAIVDVGVFLAPVGFTYAALSRRFLDIGFVVNRAAVFTGVSIILLGAFVLVEWLLTDWLSTASHTANVLVSGGVAVALGLSIRLVHHRVDRVVDQVFFRRRHEDEEAIRTSAREAPYVTDPNVLLQRAVETLERHTDAITVDIVRQYDENDPAVVRLRAFPRELDLHDFNTQLCGDIAFPITARGQLLGIVVLGARRSGELYAPDEVSAISQLAASLGAALDVFSTRNGKADLGDHLVASIGALREELVAAVKIAVRQEILAANGGLREERQ